jgi:anti-anti-sigma factor
MRPDHEPHAFEIVAADVGGAPGIAVRGEADLATTPELALAIDAAIRDSEGAFVIDLSETEVLDSSGLSALLRARALLARDDRDLAIVCPRGPVRRLIDVAGVIDLYDHYHSRDEAVAALVPR